MRMREPQSSGAHHLNLCHIVEKSAKAHPISHWGAQEQLCFPSSKRRSAACWWNVAAWPADSKHKNAICLIDLKLHNSWAKVCIACSHGDNRIAPLARMRKWGFSVNNATFASHLLQAKKKGKKKTGSKRKKLMRNKTKAKHCWVWRRKWSVSLTSLNWAHIHTDISHLSQGHFRHMSHSKTTKK